MESNMKEELDMCSGEDGTRTSEEGGEEEEEEEELALFKDMKALERQEFLHCFSDDSDESISIKLGSFSSFKFYLSGKHADPLNADTGRTDYNWLLTPPATPLFPKLDTKTSYVEISERRQQQSKPRTSPRISRTEPSPRRTRSSSCTQHSSLFSSSCSSSSHSRGRTTSSTLSSRRILNSHQPTSTIRSSSDTINSSPALARSSTPSSKISPMSFQKSSTGSTSSCCSSLIGKSAPSLQEKTHQASCSVQKQVQHMTIPCLLSQPPPNLIKRTSGHSSFHKRASSPVSSFSRETEKKSRRQSASPASSYRGETEKKSRHQSASPTFLRNGGSSKNQDCDPHVSKNKGCRLSSSTDVRTDPSLKIKQRSYTSNRVPSPLKGARRPESVPMVSNVLMSKRCSNTRTQQRNSQSMFRPLLSDLPVTSFYAKEATRIALVTEVPDSGNRDLESKSSKCSFIHDQVKIKDIEMTEVESQVKYVVREESTNQDSQYIITQTQQDLPDDRIVQSALGVGKPDMIGTSQGSLRSEFQSKENYACCQDSNDSQNCAAKENIPVHNVLGNALLEGKVEMHSRLIDSFKLPMDLKDNLQDQEADTWNNVDSPGNLHYLISSCKGLNNDEVASSSNLNDIDTHKFECHVVSQMNISRPHIEDLACKSDVHVRPGILTIPRDHGSIHEAGVLNEGGAIEGSVDLFAYIVSDRCSVKGGDGAVTGTDDDTNSLKHTDTETHSGNEMLLCLQESLFASQKDEKPIGGSTEMNIQDADSLSKDISILDTQEQKYYCSKSPELLENSGCLHFESNGDDSVTQALPAPCKQAEECTDSVCGSVIFEIGNSPKPYATASRSNLETEMEHQGSSTLEGDALSDGNSMRHVPKADKAKQVHVSQGDKTFHGNVSRRWTSKSMTLEEAADTVLFCNSIVHDLVYKSTMIAMQKEIVGVTPIPTVDIAGMSLAKRRNFCRGAASQRMLTYKSINSRKTVAHLQAASSRVETTIEDQQPVMHVSVGESNNLPKPEKVKPEKVKSRCHCTIL